LKAISFKETGGYRHQAETMVQKQEIAGIIMPPSRVNSILDKLGINAQYEEVKKMLDDLKANKGALHSLPSDTLTWVSSYNSQVDEKTKEPLHYTANVDISIVLKDFEKARFRISDRTPVALAALIDSLVHDIAIHAIKNTVAADRRIINTHFFLQDFENCNAYPMICALDTYKNLVDAAEQPAAEETVAATEDPVPIIDETGPKHNNSLNVFIQRIFVAHIGTHPTPDGKTKRSLSISQVLMDNLNDVLTELISQRLVRFGRLMLNARKVRTLSSENIVSAYELIYQDFGESDLYNCKPHLVCCEKAVASSDAHRSAHNEYVAACKAAKETGAPSPSFDSESFKTDLPTFEVINVAPRPFKTPKPKPDTADVATTPVEETPTETPAVAATPAKRGGRKKVIQAADVVNTVVAASTPASASTTSTPPINGVRRRAGRRPATTA